MFCMNPEDSFYITYSVEEKKRVRDLVDSKYHKRVIMHNNLPICGFSIKKLFIDEYDFIKDKAKFSYMVLPMLTEDAEIIIKTTPSKVYKKQNLAIAQLLHFKPNYNLSYLSEEDNIEVNELKVSLISHPNCKVYDSSLIKYGDYYTKCEINGEMFE